MGVFIDQIKKQGVRFATQKNSTLCNTPLLEKSRNPLKMVMFGKMTVLVFFCDFFSNTPFDKGDFNFNGGPFKLF